MDSPHAFNVAPSGTTPSSTGRHSAIASFLANATTPDDAVSVMFVFNRASDEHESDVVVGLM
jgi:hypothetical protein